MSALKSALTLAYYQALSNNILQELSLKIHANIIYRLSKCLYLITCRLLIWGCRGGRVRKRRGETPRVGKKENQPIRTDFPDAVYRVKNRPGINRSEQIKSLIPYLNFLSDHEISDLWDACNKMGWYQLRRDYLDPHLDSNDFGWKFLSEDRIEISLNEFLKEGHHWVDKWLDEFIETGVTTDYVFEVIGRWLEKNKTLAAVQVVRRALLHVGNRRHLEIIKNIDIEPKSSTQSIILDTEFGVKRRTLQ